MEAALKLKRINKPTPVDTQTTAASTAVKSTTIQSTKPVMSTATHTTCPSIVIPRRIILPFPFPAKPVAVTKKAVATKKTAAIKRSVNSSAATRTHLSARRIIIGPAGVVNLPPGGVVGGSVGGPSRSSGLTWDEKMRASLGDAEKDSSHVSKRIKVNIDGVQVILLVNY